MNTPDLDLVFDGLRHRKWVLPAIRYADGGVRGERWIYCVGEKPYAVTFTVLTGRYLGGYTRPGDKPTGLVQLWHRAGAGDHPCIYLDGETCEDEGSGLDAQFWYAAQPKDADGFVADADVFTYVRDLYAQGTGEK